MLVSELKSEALKERHWKEMMKELRVNWNLSDLTLGQVSLRNSDWNCDRLFDNTMWDDERKKSF